MKRLEFIVKKNKTIYIQHDNFGYTYLLKEDISFTKRSMNPRF